MTLRRRELLAAAGTGTALGAVLPRLERDKERRDGTTSGSLDETAQADLLALAEVLYPDAVEFDASFVTKHVKTRVERRQRGIRNSLEDLDGVAKRLYGDQFASLSEHKRLALLRQIGVGRTGSDPDGTVPERIRYYLVNELLYAFYTDPLGSELFGISNPVGYPGGYGSYQQQPDAARSER